MAHHYSVTSLLRDNGGSCLWTTGVALPENIDLATELTIANGETASLISIHVSNAQKYANMSENFICKTLTLYVCLRVCVCVCVCLSVCL